MHYSLTFALVQANMQDELLEMVRGKLQAKALRTYLFSFRS